MKPHYFNQDAPDKDDIKLQMCIAQGYVPTGCLLNGIIVWDETNKGRSACRGCRGPREKCKSKIAYEPPRGCRPFNLPRGGGGFECGNGK